MPRGPEEAHDGREHRVTRKSSRQVDRHWPRKRTRRASKLPQRCPTLPTRCSGRQYSIEIWPLLAEKGHWLTTLGKHWPTSDHSTNIGRWFAESYQMLGKSWPEFLPAFDQSMARFGKKYEAKLGSNISFRSTCGAILGLWGNFSSPSSPAVTFRGSWRATCRPRFG